MTRRFALMSVAALVLGLGLGVARAEKKEEVIKAEGKTYCAHCEFGIDEGGCGLAVKTADGKIYVLKGEGDTEKQCKKPTDEKKIKFEAVKLEEKKTKDGTAYVLAKATKIEDVK
jgi:hypothetical protein